MATSYTTVAKVAALLGFPSTYFDANSTPTTSTVDSYIDMAEARIDEETGHSWRATEVSKEYLEPKSVYLYGTGISFKLSHRKIRTLDALEIWDGSNWVDWVATKTEGRDADYWFDADNGFVYLVSCSRVYPRGVRVDYTYGDTTVKSSISQCATIMAALMVLNSPEFSVVAFTQVGEQRTSWTSQKETWDKEVQRIIENNREFQ